MPDAPLSYRLAGASWSLVLPPEAIQTLLSHAQRKWWAKEAVGQLYSADPGGQVVRVDKVTRLPPRVASRTGLRLHLPVVAQERAAHFEAGLHCLGFWHTHPQPVPTPSPDDTALAEDHARAAGAAFAGLVFAIVGTAPAPEGIGMWVHDGSTLWRATPEGGALAPRSPLLS
jgi:proteasome lid subunit RPN8/RPN11